MFAGIKIGPYALAGLLLKSALATWFASRYFKYSNITVDQARPPGRMQLIALLFFSLGSVSALQLLSVLTENIFSISLPQPYDPRFEHFGSLVGFLLYYVYLRFTLRKSKQIPTPKQETKSSQITASNKTVISPSDEHRRIKKVSTSNYIPDEYTEPDMIIHPAPKSKSEISLNNTSTTSNVPIVLSTATVVEANPTEKKKSTTKKAINGNAAAANNTTTTTTTSTNPKKPVDRGTSADKLSQFFGESKKAVVKAIENPEELIEVEDTPPRATPSKRKVMKRAQSENVNAISTTSNGTKKIVLPKKSKQEIQAEDQRETVSDSEDVNNDEEKQTGKPRQWFLKYEKVKERRESQKEIREAQTRQRKQSIMAAASPLGSSTMVSNP